MLAKSPHAPHNIEAEQALLGALLLDAGAYERVASVVCSQDFSDQLHARIFEVCGLLVDDKRLSTPVNIKGYFDDTEVIEGLTVGQYLGHLAADATSISGAYDYAQTVKDLARRRALYGLGVWLQDVAGTQARPVGEITSDVIATADELLSGLHQASKRQSLADAAKSVLAGLDADEELPAVPTGLVDLDRLTGGHHRGEFIVIAARPSMGKTALTCSTLLQVARKSYGVEYFSLEMTADALTQRCLSDLVYNSMTPIPYVDIRARRVMSHDIPRLKDAAQTLAGVPFNIDATPSLTVAEIASRARQRAQALERQGKRLDIVVIDHMGKVKPSSRYQGNKVVETGEVSSGLAALAKELDVAVIALCQLSRQVEGRDNKRPTLSDLRWAGEIEQDADTVMFLYRSAYYLEREKFDKQDKETARQDKLESVKNDMEILVEKQRSGPCRSIKVFCDLGSNVVRDRA